MTDPRHPRVTNPNAMYQPGAPTVDPERVSLRQIKAGVACLSSDLPEAAEYASRTLVAVGRPAVGPLLIGLRGQDAIARERIVETLVAIGPVAVKRLIEATHDRNRDIRAGAVAVLAMRREVSAADAVRTLLLEEMARRRRQRRTWWIRNGAWIVLLVGMVVLLVACGAGALLDPILRGAAYILSAVAGGRVFDAAARMRRDAVAFLGQIDDPRMVGALAVCLGDADEDIRRSATVALVRLLPRVTPADRRSLSPEEMGALIAALRTDRPELVIPLLQAFGVIGDERTIPAVMHVAHTGRSAAARRTARECLHNIRAHVAEMHEADTLLRASSATPAARPDELLRPAQGAPVSHPDELLRADPTGQE
jgi:HEAT repeat protein